MASVGLEMAIATVLGWWIGQWLDRRYGTEPWLMLLFLLLGVAAGFKGLFRAVREAKRTMRESKE
jgi:ATP synthase protein I